MLKRFLVITGVIILATACSSGNNTYRNKISESDDAQLTGLISKLEKGERGIHQTLRTNRPRSGLVSDKALAGVYNEWAGTRYRMGGSSKRGIDCSAFMQTTFLMLMGLNFLVLQRNSGI
ncbi:lipoprotein NlpC [Rodentibacter pneumotropicus]|uniref:Lipoprotein NlpC n=1 Tax=Rodentibacter pneumotropicus TaxID=758 RepID=A0A3S4W329_9PAST|nr:lipoprotein NlpC [Rodentibacter pneumotropicus]